GQGRAPLLQISDVPAGTVSLVLIVDDPDAPAGVFTHWLAWNINAAETNLNPNNPPAEAVVGVNSAGSNKYVPPCPPRGIHHYYYRLYALDEKLNLSVKSQASQIAEAITGHIIAEAVIMGKVEKK
ncbi:MAG TPA: YbhB/YbcL family Raf kinase inhibitor-like protein, partial [Candidatus Methylomirabilis sp.]|nr:YbhB/YbcL family Raf kinase inhibitor-like protein [Candidatus Methylomirabilis sp.]